ncbi:Fe(3+) ABC transporter substrate-binding protein [Paralimibaculum aggregatum]|uniref:Fe(3+) ABC transporter substrate-binding protein n=1 Tax=Paralimibaculum aggregatum TaxID=3036245 RepID=A0ABQ6LJP5_9RHOB|nr:Fe(3+) ABC transporter substrate-binding protein [Limibaculum sp. NKW23]GMG83202.1 Fe(3+) ABC transporter substrate-binding protein [Limibaculum sp. NKW23]
MTRHALLAAALAVALAAPAMAEGELNLYSSRHYDTDERLYSDFEAETGIRINRIEGKADALIERMKAEGANSPADVLITVDAGRIWRAVEAELLQPVESETLDTRVPAALRHPGGLWFGISSRARIIFYSKERVAEPPQTYADLADPKYKGMICTRSSSNIYMLSLMASRIAHDGPEAAKAWGEGLWANRAREPQGGDTDQLRGIVSGECDIAIANTYYFARGLRKDVRDLSDGIDGIGWVFPDQDGDGAHVNISAAAVARHAPNRENAVKFIEYLVSDSAQEYFAAGNDEFPVVEGVGLSSSVKQLGAFKADELNLSALGEYQPQAQAIYDEIGYK